jgi:hypothetical protein
VTDRTLALPLWYCVNSSPFAIIILGLKLWRSSYE